MRNKNLISGLALAALAASGLALSQSAQAHERAYSAPRVIHVGRRHHDDHGGYYGPRNHSYGKRHHGLLQRRHHDHHEYYGHHRERSHDGYRHGGYRYGERDHGTIRFRIDYREIL
jgi:hypothetical protein